MKELEAIINNLKAENERLSATLVANDQACEELVVVVRDREREARARVKAFRQQCHQETLRVEMECAAAIQALEKENHALRSRLSTVDSFDENSDKERIQVLQAQTAFMQSTINELYQPRIHEINARYEMLFPALAVRSNAFREVHRSLYRRLMQSTITRDPFRIHAYQLLNQFVELMYEEKKKDADHASEAKLTRALRVVSDAYSDLMQDPRALPTFQQIGHIQTLANEFNSPLANVIQKMAGIFMVMVGVGLVTACAGLAAATAGLSLPVTVPVTLAISSLFIKVGITTALGLSGAAVSVGGVSFFKQATVPELSQSCTAIAKHLRTAPGV